jgi:hypothetical protein
LIQHFNKTENAVSFSVNVPRKKPAKKNSLFRDRTCKTRFFNLQYPETSDAPVTTKMLFAI